MSLQGEWWLDEDGQATFADGDIGDMNHEMVAFYTALRIDPEDPELIGLAAGEPFPRGMIARLRAHGSPARAIRYLKDGSDARDYALQYMGWIRVKGDNAEVWKFDDAALSVLQSADFWESDWTDDETGRGICDDMKIEDSNNEFSVEEASTRKFWTFRLGDLMRAKHVVQLTDPGGEAARWHGRWQGGEGGFPGFGRLGMLPPYSRVFTSASYARRMRE